MAQILRDLSLRSRNDRYAIYMHYFDLNSFPTLTITGPEDPNLDSVGLFYIYAYIFQQVIEPGQQLNVLPVIESVILYIRATTVSGAQVSMDLNMNQILALITATVPYSEINSFTYDVLKYLAPPVSIFPVPLEYFELETIVLLIFILASNTFTIYDGDQALELPPAVRVTNYTRTENYMMFRTGAASIAKSFAQPLPNNAYNDCLCTYSYNLFSRQGNLIHVVLSQTDLLFKKK